MKNILIIIAIIAGISSTCEANDSIVKIGSKAGRTYHQSIYPSCKTCHDNGLSVQPSDTSCLQCHNLDKIASETSLPEDKVKSRNPHDSFHYGRDVPCIECHGEHKYKPPLCSSCHSNLHYSRHQ